MNPLVTWEVQTISALALEAYIDESRETAIVHRERWIDAAEAARQTRAVEDDIFRRSLHANAIRLGIPVPPAPRRAPRFAPDGHSVASDEYAARWHAVTHLVETLPTDHGFRKAHRLFVTQHTLEAQRTGIPWEPTDLECYEILHLLERARTEFCQPPRPTEAPTLAAVMARTRSTP